jgi:seryl-tRNA synthetase
MLDINLIRENPESVASALLKRMSSVDFSVILRADDERKNVQKELDELRSQINQGSTRISLLKREGKDTRSLLEDLKKVSDRVKLLESNLSSLDKTIVSSLEVLPNIPSEDVVAGGKEKNEVIKVWSKQPEFAFKIKDHVQLGKDLGLVDLERGAKLGGHGFWIYKGNGAILEWALLNYFVEEHIRSGYEFILPPHILNYECGYTAGQFPKFADDVFSVGGSADTGQGKFLIPTSETALVNLHRGEILHEDSLPLKYFAYSPCYRKEAGSYRTEERGTVRGHQFNKVELFQFAKPEESDVAHHDMVSKVEKLVQGLNLHYRVSKLAAGDCSDSMAKTYDIEIWIPSMNEYKEVSSASNALDYQARRGDIRYKPSDSKKTAFVHTLNASGLATSRLLPALLEQSQTADGRVRIPEVLRKWLPMEFLA